MSFALPRHPRSLCSSFLKFVRTESNLLPFSVKTSPIRFHRANRPFSVSARLSFNRSHQLRMEVELTAPNGKKWSQPLGLFINNEFVKSSNEQKLASVNPAYVHSQLPVEAPSSPLKCRKEPRRRYARSTPPLPMTSMLQLVLPERRSRLRHGNRCLALRGELL